MSIHSSVSRFVRQTSHPKLSLLAVVNDVNESINLAELPAHQATRKAIERQVDLMVDFMATRKARLGEDEKLELIKELGREVGELKRMMITAQQHSRGPSFLSSEASASSVTARA